MINSSYSLKLQELDTVRIQHRFWRLFLLEETLRWQIVDVFCSTHLTEIYDPDSLSHVADQKFLENSLAAW